MGGKSNDSGGLAFRKSFCIVDADLGGAKSLSAICGLRVGASPRAMLVGLMPKFALKERILAVDATRPSPMPVGAANTSCS
jgi:hypothetical protein